MRHLITLSDLSSAELTALLDEARKLRAEWRAGGNRPYLQGKSLAMVFQKPSLRTRVSFERAMQQVGGTAMYLSPNEIRLGERESVADVARVLSRYVDAIMARVFRHEDLLELAEYSNVPVINGLSDMYHPCQALADYLTMADRFGRLQGLTLAYIGDGNNVAHSLLAAGPKLGVNVRMATPVGYEPNADVVRAAQVAALACGCEVTVVNDPAVSAQNADALYTDVWASMGQEAEAQERLIKFVGYQVNANLLAQAAPDAIVLHCLPAHRGEEIAPDVIDGPQSAVFDQAENRMHVQKAVLTTLLGASTA